MASMFQESRHVVPLTRTALSSLWAYMVQYPQQENVQNFNDAVWCGRHGDNRSEDWHDHLLYELSIADT